MSPIVSTNRIVIYSPGLRDKAQKGVSVWHSRLSGRKLPVIDWDLNKGDDQCDVNEVTFAVIRDPPKNLLTKFPNLKVIQSARAGVDHLVGADIPANVPVLRIVDPGMCQRMTTWMVWAVTNIHRKMDDFYFEQQQSNWAKQLGLKIKDNGDVQIGIMGLGVMGGATAKILMHMGYRVIAYTRTPNIDKELDVQCFSGKQNLQKFAANCDILICLLPLTEETRNIINKELLYSLPKGASIINAGRGEHLVEQDLIEALENGQISHAILDAFQIEPLPQNSSLWNHKKIRISPHVAAITTPHSTLEQIVSNYYKAVQGQEPDKKFLVDMSRGY